jgi:Tfp pilus assembly protein PilO
MALVSPLLDLTEQWTVELAQKQKLLEHKEALLAKKVQLNKAEQSLTAYLNQLESRFLDGSNAAMAASNLQDILKNLAATEGVSLLSTKVLPPRETGTYIEVPISVQLTGNIAQVLSILYNLEHQKKYLYVTELEIQAPRRRVKQDQSDSPLRVNLVVAGIIKKRVQI